MLKYSINLMGTIEEDRLMWLKAQGQAKMCAQLNLTDHRLW